MVEILKHPPRKNNSILKKVQIIPFSPAYLRAIMEIEKVSFPTPWTEKMFLEGWRNPYCFLRLACYQEIVLGYLELMQVFEEVHLTSIAVHPDHRRRGIGSLLLTHALTESYAQGGRFLYLEVRQNNIPAISFYQRFNLKLVGMRRGYYQDTGENALVFEGKIAEILTHYQSS